MEISIMIAHTINFGWKVFQCREISFVLHGVKVCVCTHFLQFNTFVETGHIFKHKVKGFKWFLTGTTKSVFPFALSDHSYTFVTIVHNNCAAGMAG